MTSKEALEELYNNLGCEECQNVKCKYNQSTINDCDVWRNTVKQDLDRLEKLEEENEALKMGIESLHTDYKELKQTSEFVIEKFKICNKNLTDENSKLKKVIEIMVDKKVSKFWIVMSESVDRYNAVMGKNYILTQEEFDLLQGYFR